MSRRGVMDKGRHTFPCEVQEGMSWCTTGCSFTSWRRPGEGADLAHDARDPE
jgi:hypothetical protein